MTRDPAHDRRLVHRAVPYRDPGHQADVLAGPVAETLDGGGLAIVVVEPSCRSELRRVLGQDADIRFCAPERTYSAPPFTVAGRFSRAVRDAIGRGAAGVCAVGQALDLPGTDPAYWTRLDLALDHAMGDLPVEMLCCVTDDDRARAAAGAVHDEFLVDGHPVPSPHRRDGHDLLRANPQPPPSDLGVPVVTLPVQLAGLGAMRRVARRQAVLSGLGPGRTDDLVLAVNELVSNGIEHGSGNPVLRMYRTPQGLVSEITDPDACHLSFPGLTAPPPSGQRGRGMWLASELTDVLQAWTADDDPGRVQGTVVRVTMSPP